jgi:hypothetical protein
VGWRRKARRPVRRKRRGLADIGPNTNRLRGVRDGIVGASRALDRGACRDANALLKLTGAELKRGIGTTRDHDNFNGEIERYARKCRR